MTILKLWLIVNELAVILMIEWNQRHARGH